MDRDDALLVAYLCGELDEAERIRLELRLASEPGLARRYEHMLELDLAAEAWRHRHGATAAPRSTLRRVAGWGLGLASVAAAAGLIWWLNGAAEPAKRGFAVRAVAVASVDDPAGYAEALGLPDEIVPTDTLRSGDAERERASVETFFDAVRAAEQAQDEAAFAAEPTAARGHFVTVNFTCDEPSSVVVVSLDNGGQFRRRYPSPESEFIFGEVDNRFAPGPVHVLPRPVAIEGFAEGQVSVFPGFDVTGNPDRPMMWLTLAIRGKPVDEVTLSALDAFLNDQDLSGSFDNVLALTPVEVRSLADRTLAPLENWLLSRGFATDRIEAITPG